MEVRPLLGKISCPVLALNGTKDLQVEPRSNLEALCSDLPDNPFNKIEMMEGVNHLFQHCQTGMAAEYRNIEETFAPEVLIILVGWIQTVSNLF